MYTEIKVEIDLLDSFIGRDNMSLPTALRR